MFNGCDSIADAERREKNSKGPWDGGKVRAGFRNVENQDEAGTRWSNDRYHGRCTACPMRFHIMTVFRDPYNGGNKSPANGRKRGRSWSLVLLQERMSWEEPKREGTWQLFLWTSTNLVVPECSNYLTMKELQWPITELRQSP